MKDDKQFNLIKELAEMHNKAMDRQILNIVRIPKPKNTQEAMKANLHEAQDALEGICNILNKCGFTLDGGTQDPTYIADSEKYINHIVERFHTNSR